MGLRQNNPKLQYQGYAATPLLWIDEDIFGLRQFPITHQIDPILEPIDEKMRLGFRVERFIGNDLRNMPKIEILVENIQIKGKQQTVGELDCLLLKDGKPFHLEIIFKFYLYDETVGFTEIDHWIGENRRDSFSNKLRKLKEKQLPLLFHDQTQKLLDFLHIKIEDVEQCVHFRAQLYVPYKKEVTFLQVNSECIKGFYIRPEELNRFSKYQFYIPLKTDWLLDPQKDVEWLTYGNFKEMIVSLISQKSSTLCWLKYPNGQMQKFFVVWWE